MKSTFRQKIGGPPGIVIAFLIAINLTWILASRLKSDLLPQGTIASDFELSLLERPDTTVRLSRMLERGAVVLVFWATWCDACRREMVALAGHAAGIAGDKVQLLGVNLDYGEEESARFFLKRVGATFTNLAGSPEVAEIYRVSTLPTIYVIGGDGKICSAKTGFLRTEKIVSLLRRCGA